MSLENPSGLGKPQAELSSSHERRSVLASYATSGDDCIHKPSAITRTAASHRRFPSVRGGHPIRNIGILLALLLSVFAAQLPGAASAHGHDGTPPEFDVVACYQLVRDTGRPIAWARWEKGLSLEEIRSAKFNGNPPVWVVHLVQEWIADAYQWHASDEQIHQWAAELGSVEDLPSAESLSVHETIAIWMRRIARRCVERDTHAKAPANLIRDEVRLVQ